MNQEQTFGAKCQDFWNKHHKKILIIGGGAIALFGAIGGIKMWASQEPRPYSNKWIESLSNKEWETEREVVRQAYASSGNDICVANILDKILYRFDAIKRARDWAGCTDYKPPNFPEHGSNLYIKD